MYLNSRTRPSHTLFGIIFLRDFITSLADFSWMYVIVHVSITSTTRAMAMMRLLVMYGFWTPYA